MRLVCWNLARFVTRLPGQVEAVASAEPDVVAFQEVTAATVPLWRHALPQFGLAHVATSLDAADPAREPAGPRRHGVLIAAREPIETLDDRPWDPPWPESVLSVRLHDGTEIHAAHVPNARNGFIKPQTCEALTHGLAAGAARRILCGDFNTPRRELPDGSIVTFAADSKGRLRPERGEPWDDAERALVQGPGDMDDAFRALRGPDDRDVSWRYPGNKGGYRIDHLMLSPALECTAFAYRHDWREAGLSDHAAIDAVIHERVSARDGV